MASPADVIISNKLDVPVRTRVTRDYWVEGDGGSIDDKLIGPNSSATFRVKAKTGHHGELDIELIRDGDKQVLGTAYIKSIKDPQEGGGLKSSVTDALANLQLANYGERHSPGDKDLRRITFTLLRASYAELRFNEVSMKSAHNSYERNEGFIQQLQWNAGQPSKDGCGSLELDVAQSKDGNEWAVTHTKDYDKKHRQLSQYLSDLTAYSNAHPGHDVIILHIDLKKVHSDNFPAELDEYIRARLLMPVLQPKDIMGSCNSLPEGARQNGWPTIAELAGKIIICLTGDETAKKKYASTDPEKRLCFADKKCGNDEDPSDTHRVFFNYNITHPTRDQWMGVFRKAAGKKDVLLRAYEVNSDDNWYDCLESGCNFIATNKIENHEWAAVGHQRFVKRTPLV